MSITSGFYIKHDHYFPRMMFSMALMSFSSTLSLLSALAAFSLKPGSFVPSFTNATVYTISTASTTPSPLASPLTGSGKAFTRRTAEPIRR